ncbi:hypothetical protein [Azospirillum sp. sgz301742]
MATKKEAVEEAGTQKYDHMTIWDQLKTTDPKHTKAFTRSGGFRGTAIKPIYTDEKMTRLFGPCGVGWGMNKPEFLIQGDLVFCTIGLWYVAPNGDRSQMVYGVGGDVLVKGKTPAPHDEAFKSAYTDALSNAMKHIGMSADVHMGQFEDSKYVQEVGADADAEDRKRAYDEDKALADKILEEASSQHSNGGIDAVMRNASHKIKAINERNPGVVTRLKGEVERLRAQFTREGTAA